MPVPEFEKLQVIDKIFEQMEATVTYKHTPDGGHRGWRAWGWVKNKWDGTTGMSSISKKATAGQVFSKGLSYVPLVGKFASVPVSVLITKYQIKALAKKMEKTADPNEKLTVSGEFMVLKGAEDLATAVRKVVDAQNDVKKLFNDDMAGGKNCQLYLDFLSATMYYKYRITRLEYYLGIMELYTVEVKNQLEQMKSQWPKMETGARECGMERLGDFWFHFDNCKGDPSASTRKSG